MANDQSFDGIATKFANNIYGTTKGKLRHTLLCELIDDFLQDKTSLNVMDLGGGTGVMSGHIARQGHNVTLVDSSEDILSIAANELADLPVTITHAELQQVDNVSQYDLVVFHAVLEWLAEPKAAIDLLASQMSPGAALSLTFFNHDATLFSNAIYGNFDYIERGMKVKNRVRLSPQSPLPPKEVIQWATDAGFSVKKVTGIRCFHDYLRNIQHCDEKYDALLALERQYQNTEPFLWLGKYIHLWLQKN